MRNQASLLFVSVVALLLSGCGVPAKTVFPDALTNSNGEVILLEDVSNITSDPSLSDDEKRVALRALGIQDEQLIDALIAA